MTKKIEEKRVGKAMHGLLMLFEQTITGKKEKEELQIGRFVSKLTRYGRGVGRLQAAKYYFVPSGQYGGGGTLTPAMAADAVAYIKDSIRAGGNNPLYKGPKMPGYKTNKHGVSEYAYWKENISYFRGKPLMTLTGTTADAIGMRKGPGGNTIITVDGDAMAPPPAPGMKSVKLASYVFVHEMGTAKMPNRPIITGSMLGWIALRSYHWKTAFRNLMRETVWMKEDSDSRLSLADDIVTEENNTSGNSALDVLANLNRQADRIDNLAKKVSRTAADLLYKTARAAKKNGPYTSAQVATLKPILLRELASSGYTPDKINEIIDIAFGGRIPREYLYD